MKALSHGYLKYQNSIRTLTVMEEREAVISCYSNLETGVSGWRPVFDERVRMHRKNLSGISLLGFESALSKIECYLKQKRIPMRIGTKFAMNWTTEGKRYSVRSRAAGCPTLIKSARRSPVGKGEWFVLWRPNRSGHTKRGVGVALLGVYVAFTVCMYHLNGL